MALKRVITILEKRTPSNTKPSIGKVGGISRHRWQQTQESVKEPYSKKGSISDKERITSHYRRFYIYDRQRQVDATQVVKYLNSLVWNSNNLEIIR
jgi:hypothetical protein